MSRIITLGNLVTRAQRRADMENSTFIADAEWKALVSEVYEDLWMAIAEAGFGYFDDEQTLTSGSPDTSPNQWALPSDFLGTIDVSRKTDSAGKRRPLRELMAQEKHRFDGRSAGEATHYAFTAGGILLYPTPPSGQTYLHRYIPQPPDLADAADATEVDLVTPAGQKFVLWGVAAIALAKEESDATLAIRQSEQAMETVREWVTIRAINSPRRPYVQRSDLYEPIDYDWEPPP